MICPKNVKGPTLLLPVSGNHRGIQILAFQLDSSLGYLTKELVKRF